MCVILVTWTAILYTMKNNTNNSAIVISPATADAICKLLYSQHGGVPMDAVIEDLGGSTQTKLNLGLILRGLKPEVDQAPRVSERDDQSCKTFVRYEMLTDRVFYTHDKLTVNGLQTDYWRRVTEKAPLTMPLAEWLSLDVWTAPETIE